MKHVVAFLAVAGLGLIGCGGDNGAQACKDFWASVEDCNPAYVQDGAIEACDQLADGACDQSGFWSDRKVDCGKDNVPKWDNSSPTCE